MSTRGAGPGWRGLRDDVLKEVPAE